MPRLREKKACPIAPRNTLPSTLLKSGFRRNSMPAPAPGSDTEQMARTINRMKSIGIIILADFSMPFSTPLTIIKLSLIHICKQKAEVLEARFKDINPELELRVLPVYLKDENIPELLDAATYDFVVDAIDTLAPKCHLIAEAMKRHIKIVSSMGAGAKSDITQVRFADIWDTYHCGLSKAVRKRLQKMGIRRKLPVVFSTEQALSLIHI